MLTRTLEPEVMDGEAEAEEYSAMDFSEPNDRFATAALELIAGVEQPRALDIGTGTADIPLRLLERHPTLRIVGVDLAASMLAIAARTAKARALDARLELRTLDAKALDVDARSFDLVMANSVAHHIPDPTDLFRQIARAVREDGGVIVRDLARPPSAEAVDALVEKYAASDTRRQRELFRDSLHAALTLDEVRAMALAAGLTDLRIAMVSDRHWTAERPHAAVRDARR